MGEEGTGDACKKRGCDECDKLRLAGIYTHRLGGNLILADCGDAASIFGIDKVPDHPEGDHTPEIGPDHCREARDTQHPSGSSGVGNILKSRLHNHEEGKGDDGEVIPSGLEGKDPDRDAGKSRNPSTDEDGHRKEQCGGCCGEELHREDRRCIGPQSHKTRVPHGELTHPTVHQVQADAEDGIDGHRDKDELKIVVHETRGRKNRRNDQTHKQ